MKKPTLFVISLLLSFAIAYGVSACGGELDSCPGITCNDCGAFGDCDRDCADDETEFCGHFGFFDDPDLRCAWCSDDPDPFASRVRSGLPTAP
jgi:hypothetical protein